MEGKTLKLAQWNGMALDWAEDPLKEAGMTEEEIVEAMSS